MPSDRTAADSVGWHDISGFQRDVLVAVATLEETHPTGTGIKERLDELYGEEIVRSRLYQALDALVERGLLEKGRGTIDARTNLLRDHRRRAPPHRGAR